MEYTNRSNLPQWLYKALVHSDYPDMDGIISVTTLIDSPKIAYLKRRHAESISGDIVDTFHMFLGTAIHEQISRGLDKSISELRMAAQVSGIAVSGQIDVLDGSSLYDIKTTGSYMRGRPTRVSWAHQVNVYRWLAKSNGYDVNNLYIMVIYKDWKSHDTQSPFELRRVDIMDDIDEYVRKRVRLHTEDPENYVCTPEEMWQDPPKYAVHFAQERRAKRVLSQEQLDAWLSSRENVPLRECRALDEPGYYIVKRESKPRRCEQYCPVSRWCDQWNNSRSY